MPSIEQAAPSRQVALPLPEELPHGLVTPPAPVRERLEVERAKHPPEVFAKNEERLLNDWTIGYIFDSLCLEVVYRLTPQGPEVLAVGTEEVIALRKTTPVAEQMKFETFLGYP
jgi:hypothetical protein